MNKGDWSAGNERLLTGCSLKTTTLYISCLMCSLSKQQLFLKHVCIHIHIHTHTHTHTHTQGHRTYMAYIYMEYTYNNMVLRLFAHLLLESTHHRGRARTKSDATVEWGNGVRERPKGQRNSSNWTVGLCSVLCYEWPNIWIVCCIP